MKKILSIMIISSICSSCASVFNSRNTNVNIVTNSPAKVIVKNDTLFTKANRLVLKVPRKPEPLEIKVVSDSIQKDLSIKSKNSYAYKMNYYYSVLGVGIIGILVDRNKAKRYTYPKTVYVPSNNSQEDYLNYMPFDKQYRNNIKLTPVRLLLSHPGLELSYERYFSKRFSTQISAAALFNLYNSILEEQTGSGYQFSVEEKYFLNEGSNQFYSSIETGYFNIINADYATYANTKDFDLVTYYSGRKTIFYLAPKFGMQVSVTYKLIVEYYIGCGVKYEERHYNNLLSPYDTWSENFWQIKIPFNLKLGYRF